MKRLKEQIEKEKDPDVKAEVKKGNIVTLMAESVNKLLKTDGPF